MKLSILTTFSLLCSSCSTLPPNAEVSREAGMHHVLVRNTGARQWSVGESGSPKGLIWEAIGKEKGIIVCLHGLQTHAAWFAPLAMELKHLGWTVIAPDRRGSGMNSGKPYVAGHVGSKALLLDDLSRQMLEARSEAEGRPVYLLGTSWGSNLATTYCAQAKSGTLPDGLIQLVPATEVRNSHEPGMAGKLAVLTESFFHPDRPQPLLFGPQHYLAGLSQRETRDIDGSLPPIPGEGERDPASLGDSNALLVRILEEDRALLQTPTAKTLTTGISLGNSWQKSVKRGRYPSIPVLVITADRDQIMDGQAAREAWHNSNDDSVTVLDAGHAVQITHPREIAASIAAWSQRDFRSQYE